MYIRTIGSDKKQPVGPTPRVSDEAGLRLPCLAHSQVLLVLLV